MDLLNFNFSQLDFSNFHLPTLVGMATVAAFGYVVGRWHRPVDWRRA